MPQGKRVERPLSTGSQLKTRGPLAVRPKESAQSVGECRQRVTGKGRGHAGATVYGEETNWEGGNLVE